MIPDVEDATRPIGLLEVLVRVVDPAVDEPDDDPAAGVADGGIADVVHEVGPRLGNGHVESGAQPAGRLDQGDGGVGRKRPQLARSESRRHDVAGP